MLSQRCRVPAETPAYLGFLWGPSSFKIGEGELQGWPLAASVSFLCIFQGQQFISWPGDSGEAVLQGERR